MLKDNLGVAQSGSVLVSPAVVRELLGHASIKLTERYARIAM